LALRSATVLMPHGLGNHRILVSRYVRRRSLVNKIEHHGDVGFASRYSEVLRKQSPHVFGKRDAKFGGPGLSSSLGSRIKGNLSASIHDVAIMPSHREECKELPKRWWGVGCGRPTEHLRHGATYEADLQGSIVALIAMAQKVDRRPPKQRPSGKSYGLSFEAAACRAMTRFAGLAPSPKLPARSRASRTTAFRNARLPIWA
jgi:hypothetical protein